jgi:endonuclease/exonuclease/phosphatase family metal-dependent hydrolase
MNLRLRSWSALGLMLAMSCQADSTSPSGVDGLGTGPQLADDRTALTVMSRNLYIGADADAVIAALASPDPSDDFPALLNAISVIGETDFPARAKALADEIAKTGPHVVGLQEVTEMDIDLTGFGIPVVLHQDFMATLLTELGSRGLNYLMVARNTNVQATPLPGLSLIDHDALLIDASRVTASNVVEQNFTLNIGVIAPGVEIKRGWVAADVTLDGVSYRVANTHLESGSAGGLDQLRAAQGLELVTSLGSAPAIMLGDFNDVPGSLMYQVIAGAGFTDAWSALHPDEPGLTCCHLANLANESPIFDQRIDYVFARGIGRLIDGRGIIIRVGASRKDRIPGPAHPIWPSDHAGLVASLLIPPSLALRN